MACSGFRVKPLRTACFNDEMESKPGKTGCFEAKSASFGLFRAQFYHVSSGTDGQLTVVGTGIYRPSLPSCRPVFLGTPHAQHARGHRRRRDRLNRQAGASTVGCRTFTYRYITYRHGRQRINVKNSLAMRAIAWLSGHP